MFLVTETTFARQVLRASLPVLVCFGLRGCPGLRAMLPALEAVAAGHQGRLLVATALVDHAPLLAEQYGVSASPTLLAFQDGEPQGRVVGFIPDGLVRLLADDVMRGAVAGNTFWSPVEEIFEDTLLIPLLQSWDCTLRRQVACVTGDGIRQRRGRIDLLVYRRPLDAPLTLIESKRQIRGDQDLRAAAAQASAYARSLGLPSFIIAAPRGLWIYRLAGEQAIFVRHITSLALQQEPDLGRQLIELLLGYAGCSR